MVENPAKVLAYLLVFAGFGTWPEDDGTWSVSWSNMPENVDSWITVFNTGTEGGRNRAMPTGDWNEYPAYQIRVRPSGVGQDPETAALAKCKAIIDYLNRVYRLTIAVDAENYFIQSVSTGGPAGFLQQDERNRMRDYVINGHVTLERA